MSDSSEITNGFKSGKEKEEVRERRLSFIKTRLFTNKT